MTRDPRRLREIDLHCFTVNLLRATAVPGVWWNHSPAGEKRDAITGAKLKRMGTQAGYPDLEIFLPDGARPAFLEFKSGGGKLSPEQKQWRDYLDVQGYKWAVAKTPEEAKAFLVTIGAVRSAA
jgi:hypothetical protein